MDVLDWLITTLGTARSSAVDARSGVPAAVERKPEDFEF